MSETPRSLPPKTGAHLGVGATMAAFVMWGLLPVYWKQLARVPEWELLAHRVLWTFVFAAVVVSARRRWGEVAHLARSKAGALRAVACAGLLGTNWLIFLWAVNHDHVVDCSLGYFVNPLMSVLLGWLLLRERLGRWKLVAVTLAAAGVACILIGAGRLPWIGMSLAVSFALYGLLRKTAHVESLPGLMAEAAVLAVPGAVYVAMSLGGGEATFTRLTAGEHLLLVGTGAITAMPLLCFAYGARRINLSTVGFCQYLAPTCMFVLGVFVYDEPLTGTYLVAFALIWAGLAVYSADAVLRRSAAITPE